MKIAIITALSGNKEQLVNPSVVHAGVDYIAFVDHEWPNATAWKQLPIKHFSTDSRFAARRNAKQYKILPHIHAPGYDFYFWVDISHDVVADPFKICSDYFQDSYIAVFPHTQRKCIYEEAKVLKELQYDHSELIDNQIEYYKSNDYPENNGLWELSAFVRDNSHETQELNERWWSHIEKYSSRDQLSLPYCMWWQGIHKKVLPGFSNGHNPDGTIGCNKLMPQVRQHVSSGPR